jgi:hypothetical protein
MLSSLFMRPACLLAILFLLLPIIAWGKSSLPSNTTRSTVLIVNYTDAGEFKGWGSGFFVDEGVVVTNKHVIDGGSWYRVYATNVEEGVNFECFKKITKSDVKINLDDDVAYMRVFLPCEHGIMRFADDPAQDAPISVIGYTYQGSVTSSLQLTVTSGTVTGQTEDGWLSTDARLDVGNSGGPVVDGTEVVGVAVAKGTNENGDYLEGYFIPSSVILKGLLYANNSGFGYTPQSSSSRSSSPRSSSVSLNASLSSSRISSSTSRSSRMQIPASSQRSVTVEKTTPSFELRTCARVIKWFQGNRKMHDRVNERLMRRFGFGCR